MDMSENHSDQRLSIGELAERAGVSRRAVRFYVQQRLLPAQEMTRTLNCRSWNNARSVLVLGKTR